MTTGEKTGIGIAVTVVTGIGIYILGVYQGWWRNIFATPEPTPAPDKSEYEKCIDVNKAKQDGDACTSCVPANSSEAVFNGEIKSGECQRKAATPAPAIIKRYMIGNQNGALVYTYSNGTWMTPKTPNRVTYGTEVRIIAMSPDKLYMNTNKGWLAASDIVAKPI